MDMIEYKKFYTKGFLGKKTAYYAISNGIIIARIVHWSSLKAIPDRRCICYGEKRKVDEIRYYLIFPDPVSKSWRVLGFSSLRNAKKFIENNFNPDEHSWKWERIPRRNDTLFAGITEAD